MATYVKFQTFVEALAEKAHDLGADTLEIALTNTAPTVATDDELADISQVSYTNCSTRVVTTSSSSQTTGTYSLVCADLTLTASGGNVGPFRYVVLFNQTSVGDKLIAYWDYGSSITLASGETLLIDFGASVLTLA